MTKYALTGVTGHFGQTAVKKLAELVPANDIVALARNTAKAEELVPAGVEVRPGDYDDEQQLVDSLQGVDKLLLISSQPGGAIPRLEQHNNVINAAKTAGVKFIAYTSFPHADTSTTPLSEDHRETEKAIIDAGIQHSFLRNNWYLENEAATLNAAASGKPFVYSAGDGKTGWALESEYAQAAAIVLANDDSKEIYELSGKARTYRDLADAMDGNFDVLTVTDDEYEKGLEDSGLDAGVAELITSFQTYIREGQLDGNDTDLVAVLGHDLTPISDAIKTITE